MNIGPSALTLLIYALLIDMFRLFAVEWRCQDVAEQDFPMACDVSTEEEVVIEDCNILQSDETLDNTTMIYLQQLSARKR